MAEQKMDPAQLQIAIDESGGGWKVGESSVSKLSEKEQNVRLGYTPGPDEPSLQELEQVATAKYQAILAQGMMAYGYPTAFDLRNVGGRNYITPVRDQGGCGSCVAFGAIATIEGTARKRANDPNLAIDLSEAHLFYCIAGAQGRNCGNGWWVPPSLTAAQNPGIVDEACFPYTAGDQACKLCTDWQNRVAKITSWHEITAVTDMKNWLSTNGPLAACYTVYSDFFQYKSGIYRHVSGDVRGGHCVSCVGYNDTQQYWIMKNSWGAAWGEQGFFRIGYGQCGIDARMWAVDAIEDTRWYNAVKIRGLWTIDEVRNAWVFVSGFGWKRISNENDAVFCVMLTQLAMAKAADRPVNIRVEKGAIKEAYVL